MALHAVLQQAAATVAAMPGGGAHIVQQSSAPGSMQHNNGTQRALPSVSEELAMAAHLAPAPDTAAKAMMAESQPANGTSEEVPKGQNGNKRELPSVDRPIAEDEPEGKRLRPSEIS